MSAEATQTSMYTRQELEQKIERSLSALEPDGEINGTTLGRYTHWRHVREIPAEELAQVFLDAEHEAKHRAYLGDARYFDTITVDAQLALMQAALDEMKERMAFLGYKGTDGCFRRRLRVVWNQALKECRISQEPLDITDVHSPPKPAAKGLEKSRQKGPHKSPAPKKAKKRAQARQAVFQKPTLEEVLAYCLERKNHVDPTAFWHHYDSNGWKVGKNPMKSWKSAVVTWERREEYAPRGRGDADHVGHGGNAIPVGGGHKAPDGSGDILAGRGYVPIPRNKAAAPAGAEGSDSA